jgi:hypothetical protein
MTHLGAPALMFRLELGPGIIGWKRHARSPAHDRSAMVGSDWLTLPRAVVSQTESQDVFLVARPRENV